MTQGQEDRKHQQMNEVWNLWQAFLQKIIMQRARKYHKLRGFHHHQYSVFWQTICRKEKFVRDGSLTAWLLNRNRNTRKLQHYWNKDLTLKVKHSCIELSLLTECGLETLNQCWNCSQTSAEVQPSPAIKKISTRTIKGHANDDLCLWSPRNHHDRQSSMWNKCESSILSWLDAKIAQKNA